MWSIRASLSVTYPSHDPKCSTVGWNYLDHRMVMWQMYTPCEKVMGLFFRHKLFIHYFVGYHSFHTWHTLGGQYELFWFQLDFDHWLHPSDTLKRATRSKPDVASVWPMQCAWVISGHGENDRYWRVVRMQEVGINYYKLSKPVITH